MSYAVASRKPFSGPEDCSSTEHWDAESGSCQAGLCPPGEVLDASGNCNEPGAAAAATPSESTSSSSTPVPAPSSSGGGSPVYVDDTGTSGGLSATTIAVGFAALAGLTYWIIRSAR